MDTENNHKPHVQNNYKYIKTGTQRNTKPHKYTEEEIANVCPDYIHQWIGVHQFLPNDLKHQENPL